MKYITMIVISIACTASFAGTSVLNTIPEDCSKAGVCKLDSKTCPIKQLNISNTPEVVKQVLPVEDEKIYIHWQEYSPELLNQSTEPKLPILLFGKSAACPWSMKMENTTFQSPAVIKLIEENYLPIKFDLDRVIELGIKYQIVDLPTIIILDPDKKIIKIITGYTEPDAMEKILLDITKIKH